MEFKDRLKSLRKEKGLTQVKLGEMLNYGYTAIANYESGRNQPSIPDLIKIAEILNVSMDYLLGITDVRHPFAQADAPALFEEFQHFYGRLTPAQAQEALLFMKWLAERDGMQDETLMNETEALRVAEKTVRYTAKKEK